MLSKPEPHRMTDSLVCIMHFLILKRIHWKMFKVPRKAILTLFL